MKMEDCDSNSGSNIVPRALVLRLRFSIGSFHSGQFDLGHCTKLPIPVLGENLHISSTKPLELDDSQQSIW